jgi:hypothetical protein
VSIISVDERREAKGLDAHVPLIQRGDALMIPIWIASFSTCRCRRPLAALASRLCL